MDIYQFFIKERDTKGKNEFQLSYAQIAKHTELTHRQVRLEIARLIKEGYISVTRTGTNGTYIHKYKVNDDPHNDAYSIAKLLYCDLVMERSGKEIDVLYQFNGYHRHFNSITEICTHEKLDVTLYMLAMFHTFPANWCNQKFKKPYPPPFILVNKVHAKDRYNAFIRFVYQHSEPEKIEKMQDKEKLEEELRIWRLMGQPRANGALRLLVENKTISESTLKYIKEQK